MDRTTLLRLAAARRLEERGRLRAAERLYRDAADAGGPAEAFAGLGRVLGRQESLAEAESALQMGLARYPRDPALLAELGRSLAALGRHDEARASLVRALRRLPADAELRFELGRLEEAAGRLGPALREFGAAVRLRPDDVEARLRRLALLLEAADFDDAFAEADRLARLPRLRAVELERVVFPFGERGRPPWTRARMRRNLDRLLPRVGAPEAGLWPHVYRLSHWVVLSDRRNPGPEGSALAVERAAAARPLLGWLPAIYRLRGAEWDVAARLLRPVVRARPDFLRAGFLLVEALLGAGRRGEAAETVRSLEPGEGPDRGVWLSWAGEIGLRLGDISGALSFLGEAVARGDSMPLARCWRGACLLLSGRPGEAEADLDAAARRVPGDVEPFFWRSQARATQGRWAEALDDADRALGMRPGEACAKFVRALARRVLGDEAGVRADVAALSRARPRLAALAKSVDGEKAAREALRAAWSEAGWGLQCFFYPAWDRSARAR